MQRSTTDLLNYYRCPRLLFLNKYGDKTLQLPPSEFLKRLWKVGRSYESKVTDFFTYEKPKYKVGDYKTGLEETLKLMRKGVETIYQGVIKNDELIGIPDFLIKAKGKSDLGDYYYYAVDIKGASTSREKYSFQLACYSYILGEIQEFTPLYGGLLLLDLDLQIRYLYTFMKQVIDAIEESNKILSNTESMPDLFIDSGCLMCQWYNFCLPEANKKEDLSLVPGISRKIKSELQQLSINNYSDLAKCTEKDIANINVIGIEKSKNFILQSKALSNNQIYIKKHPEIEQADDNSVFFDFESDFIFDENGIDLTRIDYLIGLLKIKDSKHEYSYLLLEENDKELMKRFMDFANKHKEFYFYHYGHYEQSILGNKWNIASEMNLINLEKLVRESVIMPVTSYSLKNIAKIIGFQWKNKKASAQQSMCWYSNYLATKDKRFLDLSIQYNKDDCIALHIIKSWLVNLKTNNVPIGEFIDIDNVPKMKIES